MPQVSIHEWVRNVRSGQHLASFPTDTVPALAALPDAADLIYAAKSRSPEKPLILMAGDLTDLWGYVVGNPEERSHWQQVMDRYLPGALTLVLPASDRVSLKMNPPLRSNQSRTIGVRVPNCDAARQLLRSTGPLATTSVNRSGQPALLRLDEIRSQFPDLYTLSDEALRSIGIADPYQPASGQPSTVIRWTGNGWEILRQGAIGFSLESN